MSDTTSNGSPGPAFPGELPPVEPPSARFIVQLFVIPAAIVLVLVVAYLALVQLPFGRLANGGRDVMDYVRSIKSDNENRRWRSAQELANLIHNDERLARDGTLLGELTALLDRELDHPERDADPKKPSLPEYLALSLGTFKIIKPNPVDGRTVDPIATLGRAVGPEQPTNVRVAASISLSRLADREGGSFGDTGAVRALANATTAPDAEVRRRAAYALGYFSGNLAKDALRKRIQEDEDRTVQYNAAVALGRLGDMDAAPLLREMLSTADLTQTIKRSSATETESAIKAIELEALWALQASAPTHPALALKARKEIEELAKSGPGVVQVEARDLLKKLPEKP